MHDTVERNETDKVEEVTETCRRCGALTTEWTAVILVRERAQIDEIELTDADPLTVLCGGCAELVQADVELAVAAAISSIGAA